MITTDIIFLSEKYKSFVWFPTKTATSHAYGLLKNNYEFRNYTTSEDESPMKTIQFDSSHHDFDLFVGHEKYKLISTARNPYSRFVSFFKFYKCFSQAKNIPNSYTVDEPLESKKLKIKNLWSEVCESDNHSYLRCYSTKRIPDYFLRVENLYSDYINIPFIETSNLNVSGDLKLLCEIKKNSNSLDSSPWQNYMDQELADSIYKRTETYFNLLKYNKESWKINDSTLQVT